MGFEMRKLLCRADQQAIKPSHYKKTEFIVYIKRQQPLQQEGFAQGHNSIS